MVGGGSRREEAPVINSSNVFAALGSLKKKKKKPEILRRNRLHPRGEPPRPLPPPLPPPHNSRRKRRFSGPRRHSRRSHGLTLTTRMMTTTTPSPLHLNPFGALLLLLQLNPRPMLSPVAWIATRLGKGGLAELFMFSHSVGVLIVLSVFYIMLDILFDNEDPGFWSCSGYLALGSLSESDSEIEGLDDAEDEHENDLEVPVEPETVVKKPREPSLSTKETEEQLSKKELKKKELEAVLAELGLQKEPGSQADSHGNMIAEKKVEDRNGELEKKENATSESKNAKKKKKDKSSKEQKESQNLPDSVADGKTTTETAGTGKAEDAPVTDVKERHKKVASMKKKKSRRWMLLLGVQGLPWQREKIRRLTTISSLCGKQADKWQSTFYHIGKNKIVFDIAECRTVSGVAGPLDTLDKVKAAIVNSQTLEEVARLKKVRDLSSHLNALAESETEGVQGAAATGVFLFPEPEGLYLVLGLIVVVALCLVTTLRLLIVAGDRSTSFTQLKVGPRFGLLVSMENHQLYTNKDEVKRVEEGRIIISDAILGTTRRKVKVLEVSNNHIEEVQRQIRCFDNSLRLSSQHFLQGLVYFCEGETWVFIYQHYDNDLADVWVEDWDKFKLYLKQFLQALAILYEGNNMYHGNIKDYSLVISGDRAFVSGVEGNHLPDGFQDQFFTDEMEALREVLLQNLDQSPKEIDLFLDFVSTCESWNMIFCHPIFLDFQHKLYYFLIANQYLNEHLRGIAYAQQLSSIIEGLLQNWGVYKVNWLNGVNRVNDPVMMQRLNSGNYRNCGTVTLVFLRFVRNCIAHLDMRQKRQLEQKIPPWEFILTKVSLVERRPENYEAVTVCPLSSVSSLVRFAEEPQMFAVEFSDGCPIHVCNVMLLQL
ncbi:hypothetical protein AHAS_Ahas01G0237700 [Arachis hypogaea]